MLNALLLDRLNLHTKEINAALNPIGDTLGAMFAFNTFMKESYASSS